MSRARAKGTAAETAVADYLQSYGIPAERRALAGANDKGDISGIPGWCLEVKAVAATSYGAWLAEAERERRNAGAEWAAVIHKPRGTAAPGGYHVVMTMQQFTRLLLAMQTAT